ncbi:transporter substrate-binding domain-containing protein [Rhodoferax sp.]|uniref:transporter substrate-binding domain-containing protein n=2 Tax=Rhodoferax sp. TaxID=50421 RepID=UPI002622B630|nr:transporter substrate-binding domain-containing protein [Rhodoferax sp.]MDD5478851.1 transporter substrate-binding domain-containing protein [Rhodoferax sp.]
MNSQTLRHRIATLLMLCSWLLAAVVQAAPQEPVRASERWAMIKQRGQLIVGVKTDYPPFGQLNAAGQPEGFEHDLAQDIAKRLGVTLVKVGVSGANRLQKLEEGSIDMVLATTGDTQDRRKMVTMIEPNYYSSGVTLFMAPDQYIADWTETRGKKVCATQGSYFNRVMAQRYLLDLQMFNSARDAKLAVKDKRCIGYLFDNTAIQGDLRLPEWSGYKAPLPPVLGTPWAIAIAKREQGTDFERVLGDAVADWHRTGFAIEREKAWGLLPSKFLAEAHALWTKQDSAGNSLCQRDSAGQWPSLCRNPVFLNSADVSGLRRLGLWVKEHTGMDLTLVYDDYDRERFLKGLATTVLLMVLCVVASLGFGVLGAMVSEARLWGISRTIRMASVVGRMTPPLLVMYLVLFGVGSTLMASYGISLSPFAVVVGCLSYYTGSSVMTALLFAAEVQRQQRADFYLKASNLRDVIAMSSGHVTAALVNVSKATMMASAVAVPELLSAVTTIMTDNGNVTLMMNVLLLTFLILIFVTFRLLGALEKKLLGSVK